MSPQYIGIIGIVILFVLIFLNLPVGIALGVVGVVGACVLSGVEPGLSLLGVHYFNSAVTYMYSVIPLFIAMGLLASEIRLSSDAFYTLNKWIGHARGGLAMATTTACGGFAAVSGDAISTSTTVASVALPNMRKAGYEDVLSLGCLAAGGNLGFLIPPSAAFIIYAILTEQSIGMLFISGILPGILLTALFMLTIWIICRIHPEYGPPTSVSTWKERIKSLKHSIGVALLIVLVLGGIYSGIFTPCEAAGIGVFGVFVLGLAYRRVSLTRLSFALHEALKLTGKIFILISGAMLFSKFLVLTQIPFALSDLLITADISPFFILVIMLLLYILIGFIMDIFSIILITSPIMHPVLVKLGFDPVWLAVIIVMTILMGQISPPVGIVVYGLKAYVPDVSISTIFIGAFPFLLAMFLCLTLIILFPQIALFLPNLMSPG